MFKSIVEKNFDWLLKRGYIKRVVKKEDGRNNVYYYEKNNLSIKIQLNDEYSILVKNDTGTVISSTFFHEYEQASQLDRNDLRNILRQLNNLGYGVNSNSYVVNTVTPHAFFLRKYISNLDGMDEVCTPFTFNDAKLFFKEFDCNLLGVYRDEYQKYINYFSMEIPFETEEKWRQESISEKLSELPNCGRIRKYATSIIKMIVDSEMNKHKNTEILLNKLSENISSITKLDLIVILEALIGRNNTFNDGLICVVQGNKVLQEAILAFKNKAIERIRATELKDQYEPLITDLRIQKDLANFSMAQKFYNNTQFNDSLIKACEKLKENELIKNKLIIDDSKQSIVIRFNKYLKLSGDNSLLYLNCELMHFHFYNDNGFIDFILNISNGNLVFIENRNFFSLKRLRGLLLQPWNLKIVTREKFEKNKKKYCKYKWNRIYTGNEIIRSDYNDLKKTLS